MRNNLLNIIKNGLVEYKVLKNTLRVVDPELLEAQKTIVLLKAKDLRREMKMLSLGEQNVELIRVASDAVSSTKIVSQSFLELMDQNKELRAQKVLDDLEIRRLLARPLPLVDNSLVSIGYASGILSNLITIAPVAAVTGAMVIKFVYGMDPSLEEVATIMQTVVEVQPIPDIVGTVGTEITIKH